MGVFSSRELGQTAVLSPVHGPLQLQPTPSLCPDFVGAVTALPSSPPSYSSRPTVFSRPPPINTAVPQPLERVPTEPAHTPQHQPTPGELLLDGIKVRDFAFEKTSLPPVPVVRRPVVRQLKRMRDETDEEREWRQRRIEFTTARVRPGNGNNGSVKNNGNANTNSNASSSAGTSATSLQELQRQPTEPVIQPTESLLFSDLSYFSRSQASSQPLRHVSTGRLRFQLHLAFNSQSQSQTQSQSQSQFARTSPPRLPFLSTSQTDSEMDDDEYVKTPLVTPNGSLVYLDGDNTAPAESVFDASTLPESQVAPLLTESQNPAGDDVSESQMGLLESLSQATWQQQSQSQQDSNGDEPTSNSQVDSENRTPSSTPTRSPPHFTTPPSKVASGGAVAAFSSSSSLSRHSSANALLLSHRSLTSRHSPTAARRRAGQALSRSGSSSKNELLHGSRNSNVRTSSCSSAPHASPTLASGSASTYNLKLRARGPRKAAAGPGTTVGGKGKGRAEDQGTGLGSPASRPLRRSVRERH